MTEEIKLSDLQPDHRNANKGTERGAYMVEQSLRKLGAGRSILLDKNGKIIAGNKTAEAAGAIDIDDVVIVRTDGKKLVAVMREDLDLNDDTGLARELAYADNRTGQVSLEFDPDVIAADLEMGVDLGDWFQEFELEEIGALPDEPLEEGDAEPQISRADELQEEWGVELGQMWRLPSRTEGQAHRIICGDCTDADVVERVMGGEVADMMLTDPPYGVDYKGIENDGINGLPELLKGSFKCVDRVLKNGGAYYICHPDVHSYEFAHEIRNIGWKQARPAVVLWLKDTPVMGQGDYNSQTEPIFYGWKGAGHYFAGEIWSNVWEFDRPKKANEHTTEKPVGLFQNAIINSSKARWIVIEPFSGSGTTIIAAENLSRQCRAVEISPAYVAVALQRYKDAFGIEPELMS